MLRACLLAAAVVGAFALSACATVPPVWAEYDACAAQTTSFAAMVECGKQKRNAVCQAASACSAAGNAFVQYADALAMRVNNKEISEGQAQQLFAEYKTQVMSGLRRDQAIVAAGVAAGGPTTCTRIGNTVNCY